MSDPKASQEPAAASSEDMQSALFAQLVIQQSNLAMMLLGKVANPETGQVTKDIEAARLFIDTLEMLESKTKGNLTKEESALLKQCLMSLRLTYVQEVESPAPAAKPAEQPQTPSTPAAAPQGEEHRPKFSKKY
jgi:hypothetical protein